MDLIVLWSFPNPGPHREAWTTIASWTLSNASWRSSNNFSIFKKINQKVRYDDEAMLHAMPSSLLPYLAHTSRKLLSLSLQVPGNTIPDDALCNIGKLRTLEQLHLTSGYQFGTASTWDIDHDAILENLAGLSNLRKLALSASNVWLRASTNSSVLPRTDHESTKSRR
jgi:hypothetical protein